MNGVLIAVALKDALVRYDADLACRAVEDMYAAVALFTTRVGCAPTEKFLVSVTVVVSKGWR